VYSQQHTELLSPKLDQMYNVKTQMISKNGKRLAQTFFPHLTMQINLSVSHTQLTNKEEDCLYQLILSSKTTSEQAGVHKNIEEQYCESKSN
jgi:hypothetical protein